MSITGEPDGEPQKVGVPIADIMAGMYAGVAVNAALRHAALTGQGQYIDIGMMDTTVAMLANAGMNYLYAGSLGRLGNAHPNIVPYQPFRTADGYIIVAIGNDTQFQRFCQLAGRPELSADPEFATNDSRVRNREKLLPVLNDIFASRPAAEWLAGLEAQKIGCGPINTIDQTFAEPQVAHLGMVKPVSHPALGEIRVVGQPINLADAPLPDRFRPTPELGQHTDAILGGLGYDAAAIADLRARRVV